jgi:DNA helicase HerA-like ATPase
MNIKHVYINGASGCGKSYYVKNTIIKEALLKRVKTLIIDPEDEYNFPKIKNIKKIGEFFKKYDIVRYVPDITKKIDDVLNEVDEVYKYIFNNCRNMLIIIDEAPTVGASQNKYSMGLIAILTRGRKRGLKAVLISQRISQMNKTITGNCRIKIFFKCAEDIDWDRYKQINREAYEFLKNSPYPYARVRIDDGKIIEKEG